MQTYADFDVITEEIIELLVAEQVGIDTFRLVQVKVHDVVESRDGITIEIYLGVREAMYSVIENYEES